MLARRLLVSGMTACRRAVWRTGQAVGDLGEAFAALKVKELKHGLYKACRRCNDNG
jgi:hypothetical protein